MSTKTTCFGTVCWKVENGSYLVVTLSHLIRYVTRYVLYKMLDYPMMRIVQKYMFTIV